MKLALEQFFTPLPVAEGMAELLGIQPGESVIDPSCGEGVFLGLAAERGATVAGCDLDPAMAARAQQLVGDAGQIYCHDGLYSDAISEREESVPVAEDAWDVVVGNPPFRSYGAVEQRAEVLRRFALGCQLSSGAEGRLFDVSDQQESLFDLVDEPRPLRAQALEVLFLERFINLARPGGRIAIVLPDGVAAKIAWQVVRDHLLERCEVYTILGLPRETFLDVGTEAKTIVLFARKRPAPPPPRGRVCLAEARGVGIRSELNDLPVILQAFREGSASVKPLIMWKRVDEIRNRLTPGYYDPRFARLVDQLMDSGVPICELGGLISHMAYGQVGRREYDEDGEVQLLSIRNHEPTGVDFWEERKFVASGGHNDPGRTRLQEGDILLSNSGVRAIGRATMVTRLAGLANVTQHVQVIRLKPEQAPEAVVIFLQSRFGQLQIEQRITGVAASGLTYDDIRSLKVPCFDDTQKAAIRRRYKAMDQHHQAAQAAREQIETSGGAPATRRRLERELAKAEELRVALVSDMEQGILSGNVSF